MRTCDHACDTHFYHDFFLHPGGILIWQRAQGGRPKTQPLDDESAASMFDCKHELQLYVVQFWIYRMHTDTQIHMRYVRTSSV